MTVKLKILDGANTIGGNKIYVESSELTLLCDFGFNFKRAGEFYEEFLRPRSSRGIHDYLYLGLIPPINIYGLDLFPGDIQNHLLEKVRVDIILLTHAHLDHCGCAGLLDRRIPVCCSTVTATILKAYQDSGKTELHSQVVYRGDRRKTEEDSRVLEDAEDKYVERLFYVVDDCPKSFLDFWCGLPKSRREMICEPPIPFCESQFSSAIKWFPVDHSIPGATAYAVEMEGKTMVYTGDLRAGNKTKMFAENVGKTRPKVLLIEGTNINKEEDSLSEEDVLKNCLAVAEEEEGLLIADFSPRHFERLEVFIEISRRVGRKLVVLPRDAYMLDALKTVDGIDRVKELYIYKELKARRDYWERKVLDEHFNRCVDPLQISKDAGEYILCFSFLDLKNLLDIKPEGGTYIYSSSEVSNEEGVFDFIRLWNWLQRFRIRPVGFEVKNGEVRFQRGYHASGHASRRELLELIEIIDPEIVIPVHTEDPSLFKEKVKGRRVILPETGKAIEIE